MEKTIKYYLHHREPYLLVDQVLNSTQKSIITQLEITKDMPFISGHFPGAPVFPGAMMQEMCTQSAGILIAKEYNPMTDFNTEDPHHNEFALGVLRSVERAKYYSFAKPGSILSAHIELLERVDTLFNFKGLIKDQSGKKVMSIVFTLCNIKSDLLH